MLHITNGTSVSLPQTRLGGTVVCWNDVLHEGPVPAGMSLGELTRLRERFIAAYYGLAEAEVSFAERNAAMHGCANQDDEVILWFEHDLFDQLQLIQVLDWFARSAARPAKLSLINIDRYLGPLTTNELFRADQAREERIFIGDTTFRCHVQRLTACRRPLLSEDEPGRYDLTSFGRAVLAGTDDHVRLNGINRWLGGVHLCEGAPLWRWDAERSRLALS